MPEFQKAVIQVSKKQINPIIQTTPNLALPLSIIAFLYGFQSLIEPS